MLNVCSSHSVSSSSCTLRRNVRALVRNRFLATCCVMVEPPCTTSAAGQVDPGGTRQPDRVDAGMVPEPAVLHRDRGGRQIGAACRSAAAGRRRCRRRWRRHGRCGPPASRLGRRAASSAASGRGRSRANHSSMTRERQRAPDRGDDGVAAAGGSAGRRRVPATPCAAARGRSVRRAAVVGSEAGARGIGRAVDTGSAARRGSHCVAPHRGNRAVAATSAAQSGWQRRGMR